MSPPCPAGTQLEQLLTDRLHGAAEAELEQHLEQCPRCQEEMDRLTAGASDLGKRFRPAAAPPPLPEAGEAFVRRLKEDTDLLAHPSSPLTNTISNGPPAQDGAAALPVIAGYEIQHELGRGGMGVIYQARQAGLNRIVALKLIRAGSGADLARFRTEAEAVARLQHHNIVRVYDCGQAGGRAYLALEFIDGGSLKERLDGTPWPVQAAARVIETLARAVDTAHQQHIIHRDLKPSNILLASQDRSDRRPGAAGQGTFARSAAPQLRNFLFLDEYTLKIADFGLAKMLDREGGPSVNAQQTKSGAILGTPSYMAPEQAGGRWPVGPAADVYALGAILYELLTGRPPFTAETPLEILVQVLHEEPVAVTRLRPRLPRDLATITHKCLQKDPPKRYASALDLADDLRRYQEDQPIAARPIGAGERMWKAARRRPAVAALSAAVVLVTLVGVGLVAWQWRRAVANAEAEAGARWEAQQNAAAEAQARHETERLLVSAEIDRATTLCDRGDIPWGLLLLAQSLEKAVRLEDAELERVIRADLTGWRHLLVVPRAALPHSDWVWDVEFSPDGRTVLTGSKDRTAQLWDAVTGQPIGPPLRHDNPVWAVAFSPDGHMILTGCGTDDSMHGEARLWDTATGQPLGPPLTTEGTVGTVAFSADGSRILTVCRGQAQVWETPRREGNGRDGMPRPPPLLLSHPGPVWVALFSPDGRTILTGGPDGSARLWETATGIARGKMERHPGPVVAAAFRPDGKTLVTATLLPDAEKKLFVGGAVRLWDVGTCQPSGNVMPHPGEVKAMSFSPDGRTLLTGGIALPPTGPKTDEDFKGEARLWNAETTEPFGPALAHDKPVRAVAFSPDGRTFLTGSEDRFARLWLTATHTPIDFPRNHAGTVRALAYSPDGQLIVTGSAGDQASARVWTAPVGQASGSAIPQFTAALSPDGKTLLGQAGNVARPWDVISRKPGTELPLGEKLRAAAFSSDGKTLITAEGKRIEFRQATTGRPNRPPWEGREANLMMSDVDGKTLWTVARTGGSDIVQGWQLDTGKPVGEPLRHPPGLAALAQSDDGRLILACGTEGVWLWEAATGKLLAHHLQKEDWMWTAAFSPGAKTFVAAGRAEMAQLWESATGKPIGPPLPHTSGVLAAAFSRDGRTLLTGCRDGTARLWDVALGKPLGPPLPHRGGVLRVGFLPGGKEVFTSSETAPDSKDGVTAFWEVPVPWLGEPRGVLLELQVLTGMELDERGAVRKLSANECRQRRQLLQAPDASPPWR